MFVKENPNRKKKKKKRRYTLVVIKLVRFTTELYLGPCEKPLWNTFEKIINAFLDVKTIHKKSLL